MKITVLAKNRPARTDRGDHDEAPPGPLVLDARDQKPQQHGQERFGRVLLEVVPDQHGRGQQHGGAGQDAGHVRREPELAPEQVARGRRQHGEHERDQPGPLQAAERDQPEQVRPAEGGAGGQRVGEPDPGPERVRHPGLVDPVRVREQVPHVVHQQHGQGDGHGQAGVDHASVQKRGGALGTVGPRDAGRTARHVSPRDLTIRSASSASEAMISPVTKIRTVLIANAQRVRDHVVDALGEAERRAGAARPA